MAENYLMGTKVKVWKEGNVKNITFVLTEDCNLACKYCYITGKNHRNKMSLETAKKAVDFILGHPEEFPEESVIWEFIGGEPFMEIDLLDQVTDYIKTEMFRLNHKWFDNYRISMATNGTLYHLPKVQNYIQKNATNLSIGISLDGNKTKHDNQRVKVDGTGSYDDIIKNVPLWLEQFPFAGTKATFASSDLQYLKDSVISLYENGITSIPANVIFENDWKEGDDLLFESQLVELADYIIDNRLWDKFNCALFSDTLGFPLVEDALTKNWCGAGRMLAIDYQGKFYPCVRFIGYALNKREGYVIGDIENGYDHDKLRPFLALRLDKQSTDECINCQVASGCAWCQGLNYDEAKIDTIYERMTYICKMHKARVRANDYYWAKLREVAQIKRKVLVGRKDHLYFILSNQSARHCTYHPEKGSAQAMDLATFKAGLEFARQNFFTPVLLLPPEGLTEEQKALVQGIAVLQIGSGEKLEGHESIGVYDTRVGSLQEGENAILIVTREQLPELSQMVKNVLIKQFRLNLILDETGLTNEDLETYERELEVIAQHLIEQITAGKPREINVLSDIIHLGKMANCNAGIDSVALAPDGNFYICPAFYYHGEGPAIGNPEQGIDLNFREFLTLEKSPVCTECDAYHCRRCVYSNKQRTKEYLIPGQTQCVAAHVERKVARKYLTMLEENQLLFRFTTRKVDEILPELDYYDPFQKALTSK